MERMKLKITITGHNVHNVGYRYFLMTSSMDLGINSFQARNRTSGDDQEVIALIEGNEEEIAEYKKLVESKKPQNALVSNIAYEETDLKVMKIGMYAQICTAVQLNKAIPLLLDIRDDMKEMKGDMREMKGDMREMKGDMREMKGDMKAVRKNTDIIPQIHEEIKGLKEDIQPGYAAQFRLVQADIRAIKERLGMS